MTFSENLVQPPIINLMKILFALLFFIGLSNGLLSQKDNGYYGKKAIIQIEGLANYPFFSNVVSKQITGTLPFEADGNTLTQKRDLFNYGYRGTIGYAVKRNMALLIEIGQDYSNVNPSSNSLFLSSDFSTYINAHEKLNVVSTSFIPKIEFASSKSLLPMGIGHQIGFGIANSKVIEKDYLYKITKYDYASSLSSSEMVYYSDSKMDTDPINFDKLIPIRKYVLLYALSVRTPLSKSLMLNYGVRYTLNIGSNKTTLSESYIGNDQFTGELINAVSRHRTWSVINANIGLTFVF